MEAQALPRTGRRFLPRSRKVLAAYSDDRLVEQVRRGNDAAFEAIFDRHHRGVLSFSRHMLASPDEAEDAVQQTFLSAFDAIRSDARDIRLKPWLYTIARNRCISILRARREQPSDIDEIPTAGLADEVQRRSDLRELLEDLRRLPVDQRAALVLSEVGDLSHAEVGAVVGCEVAKVKSLVFQARSSLVETRRARDIPCSEIREQLATAAGGALRRGPLRRHLRTCVGCAEFRDDVTRQRRALAAILPVVPTLGLKKSALAAIGVGGGGGGAATLASYGVAAKLATAVLAGGAAVGGGLILHHDSSPPTAAAANDPPGGQAWPAPPAGTGPGVRVHRHRARSRTRPKPVAHHRRVVVRRVRAATPPPPPKPRRRHTQPHRSADSARPHPHPTPQTAPPEPAPPTTPAPVAPAPPQPTNTDEGHRHGPHGNNGNHFGQGHEHHGDGNHHGHGGGD